MVSFADNTVYIKPGEAFLLQVEDDEGSYVVYRIQVPAWGMDDGWANNILVEMIANLLNEPEGLVAVDGPEVHGPELEFGNVGKDGRLNGRFIRIAGESL